MKIASILPTRGLNQNTEECVKSLVSQGIHVVIVDQGDIRDFLDLESKFHQSITYVWTPGIKGVTKSLNLGISMLPQDSELVLIANDNSEFLSSWRLDVESIFKSRKGIGAVCGRYLYKSQENINLPIGELSIRDVMKYKESAMIFSRNIFDLGFRFNEKIGTGSSGYAWNGEGPELLFRARKKFKFLGIPNVIANDSRKDDSHNWKVEFKYAIGFSVVSKVLVGRKWSFVRIFTPLLRTKTISQLSSQEIVMITFARIVGRAIGFLIPSKQYGISRD